MGARYVRVIWQPLHLTVVVAVATLVVIPQLQWQRHSQKMRHGCCTCCITNNKGYVLPQLAAVVAAGFPNGGCFCAAGPGLVNSFKSRRRLLQAPLSIVLVAAAPSIGISKNSEQWTGSQLQVRSVEAAAAWLKLEHANRFAFARYPDPVLRRVAQPVLSFGREIDEVVKALMVTAKNENAVGLAANQAGVDARIILLDPAVVGPMGQNTFVNPRVINRSPEEGMRFWRERCLALPADVRVTLLRDSCVTVEAQDLHGHQFTLQLEGEAARAFQHELDHLNGVLIIDHAMDPADLHSSDYPQMQQLEEQEHRWRQAIAFQQWMGSAFDA